MIANSPSRARPTGGKAETAERAETTLGASVQTFCDALRGFVFVTSSLRGCLCRRSGSGAAGELARLGVDLHLLAFLDEERDTDRQAGFERGDLRHAAARGVAANARLGRGDGQLYVRGELQPDR